MMVPVTPPKEPKPVDPGVLAGLSRTRPQRRSTKRTPRASDAPSASGAQTPQQGAQAQAGAKPKPKPKRSGAKPKATSAKAKQPSSAKAKHARAKTKAASKRTEPAQTATAAPRAQTPEPTREPDAIPAAGYATPEPGSPTSGTELVATALQAAGEVTRLGGAAVRGLLSRLPKP